MREVQQNAKFFAGVGSGGVPGRFLHIQVQRVRQTRPGRPGAVLLLHHCHPGQTGKFSQWVVQWCYVDLQFFHHQFVSHLTIDIEKSRLKKAEFVLGRGGIDKVWRSVQQETCGSSQERDASYRTRHHGRAIYTCKADKSGVTICEGNLPKWPRKSIQQ